jgi:hypothetical protein
MEGTGFRAREEAVRFVNVFSIAHVGQLNQANITVLVLIFRLNPIAIDEYFGGRQSVEKTDHRPFHFNIPSSSFIPC